MKPKQFMQAGLLVLLATGLTGCGSSSEEYAQPEFKTKRTATFEPITGELPIALVRDMDVYGPYLVVVGYLDNQMVHIYDKRNGELRGSAVRLGRAANEILHTDCVTLDPQTGTLRVYDFQSRKRLSMQIDSLLDTFRFVPVHLRVKRQPVPAAQPEKNQQYRPEENYSLCSRHFLPP